MSSEVKTQAIVRRIDIRIHTRLILLHTLYSNRTLKPVTYRHHLLAGPSILIPMRIYLLGFSKVSTCVWTPIALCLADDAAVGPIAQSVEQRTFNPWVDGSSPSGPTLLLGWPYWIEIEAE